MTDSLRTPLLRRLGPALANRSWPWSIPARRVLAGALFVLAIVLALLPDTAGATARRPALVATHDLASGATLRPADLAVRELPEQTVAEGAFDSARGARGKLLAGAVRAGEQLTDARVVGAASTSPGRVAVPVRLADPAVADLLHPGALVDVLAATDAAAGAEPLARGARVVTVPSKQDARAGEQGRLVLLSLPADSAHRVAAASLRREVTVTMR